MRIFFIVISIFFFFLTPNLMGQKIGEYSRIPRSKPIFTPIDSVIQNLINQISLDSLTNYVNILSGEDSVTLNGNSYLIQSRHTYHPHNDIAADYIEKKLNDTGLPTYNQIFSATGRNVYSVQDGSNYPDQKFIVCAHYDDMPSSPPAPGADDNASGTALVLEAARVLSQVQTPYTIIFALWDEEETGYDGSEYFADEAEMNNENILGVVNVDMIGYDSDSDGLFEIHTRPIENSVELAFIVEDVNYAYQLGLLPVIQNPGSGSSDHGSFWDNDFSAVAVSEGYWSGDFNPHYHSQSDKIQYFNLNYFHSTSKLVLATISQLSFYGFYPPTKIVNNNQSISGFKLKQNYPNPFNPTTTIEFNLPHSSLTSLSIYNLLGEEVTSIAPKILPAGKYEYEWNANEIAGGMYFYRLVAGNFIETKKMVLIR